LTGWRPSADRSALLARAELLAVVRAFFAERRVLEVETPLLSQAAVTDPALENFCLPHSEGARYLQTSPEYAMKRLLAAGSGDIFQVCKAFRAGEVRRRHNPEYTLLEWYRIGFDHIQLMREVGDLVCAITGLPGWQIWSWQAVMQWVLGVDPLGMDAGELGELVSSLGLTVPDDLDRDGLWDVLMSHCVEPAISDWGVVFVTDYPASQAALARCIPGHDAAVAARFECYVQGIELANGYWECTDPDELAGRFEQDNRLRRERGLPERGIDAYLLDAMLAGLPDCAGVAMGLDRLLMVQHKFDTIESTLAFDWSRA